MFADNGPWLELDGAEIQNFLKRFGPTSTITQYIQTRASFGGNLQWVLRVPEVFNVLVGLYSKIVIFDAPAFFWVSEVKRDQFKDWQEFVGWSAPDVIELHRLDGESWSASAHLFLSSQTTSDVLIHSDEISGLPPQLGFIRSSVVTKVLGVNKQRIFLEPPSGPGSLLEWPKKKLCAGLDLLRPQLGP
ncbi:MAG: hypothetical protein NDJ89_01850 [Oligoflexia bacterium]|nr:hypothetical protein [Oligoflexia bacterium]